MIYNKKCLTQLLMLIEMTQTTLKKAPLYQHRLFCLLMPSLVYLKKRSPFFRERKNVSTFLIAFEIRLLHNEKNGEEYEIFILSMGQNRTRDMSQSVWGTLYNVNGYTFSNLKLTLKAIVKVLPASPRKVGSLPVWT